MLDLFFKCFILSLYFAVTRLIKCFCDCCYLRFKIRIRLVRVWLSTICFPKPVPTVLVLSFYTP
nr:MAG TPA: hypothetical protein [Bacteriophage sp.]